MPSLRYIPVLPSPVKDGMPITLEGLKVLRLAARCDVLYSPTPRATAMAIRRMGQISEDIRIVECLGGVERASVRIRGSKGLLREHGCIE